MEKLLDLHEKGLINDEELALAIKRLINEKKELSAEDIETSKRIKNSSPAAIEMANKNRKRAEEKRLIRMQDEELAFARTFLNRLKGKNVNNGNIIERGNPYSKEVLRTMDYFETMSLYDNIISNMSDEKRKEAIEETRKYIEENGPIDLKLENSDARELPLAPMSDAVSDDKIEETPEVIPDEIPDEISDEIPDEISDETPEVIPDETPEVIPDKIPDEISDEIPDEISDETPEVIPDEIPEEIESLPIAPNEEIIPVEEVSEPKPTLFQKLKSKVKYAIAFLAGIAAGIGGSILVQNLHSDDIEEVEETQNEEDKKVEDKKEEDKKEEDKKEEDKKEEYKKEEYKKEEDKKEEDKKEEDKKEEDKKEEDKKEEDKKEEDKKEKDKKEEDKKEEDKKKEDKKEEDKKEEYLGTPTEIAPGESIYNPGTGVEVTYGGTANIINNDGTITPQEDKKLEYTDHDTAVITEEDLNADDIETPVIEQKDLTEGEKDNLESAIDDVDWEAIFNDSYGMKLTP